MLSSLALLASSANAIARNSSRFKRPSFCTMVSPKVVTNSFNAGLPGSTIFRAIISVSIIGTPKVAK